LFFFSSRRRHTRSKRDWSSDVCSSDLSIWVFPTTSCEVLPTLFASLFSLLPTHCKSAFNFHNLIVWIRCIHIIEYKFFEVFYVVSLLPAPGWKKDPVMFLNQSKTISFSSSLLSSVSSSPTSCTTLS